MPTFRDVLAGLAIGSTLAGGLVGLGAITGATSASAGVIQTSCFDGCFFAGGDLADGGTAARRFARNRLREEALRGVFRIPARGQTFIDLHNADFSREFINSFNRQRVSEPNEPNGPNGD